MKRLHVLFIILFTPALLSMNNDTTKFTRYSFIQNNKNTGSAGANDIDPSIKIKKELFTAMLASASNQTIDQSPLEELKELANQNKLAAYKENIFLTDKNLFHCLLPYMKSNGLRYKTDLHQMKYLLLIHGKPRNINLVTDSRGFYCEVTATE
jgi:hypothetical protein